MLPSEGSRLDDLNQNTHPAYLSVEVATDKSTSGKISIPQVVSVSEVAGLSLTWSQTQYICQHACVSTLHAACVSTLHAE